MPEAFREFLSKYISPNAEQWNAIRKNFKRREFHRNELILEEGKICRHFYFFEKGLVRFYYNHDGEDITKTFAIAPQSLSRIRKNIDIESAT